MRLIFPKSLEHSQRFDPVSGLLEPLASGISFAVIAKKKFEEGDSEKKREVCQTVFSNLTMKEKTLLAEAKFPFRVSRDLAQLPDVCTRQESNLHCQFRKLASYPLNDKCMELDLV